MSFLDVIIVPFSSADSALAVFLTGVGIAAAVSAVVSVVLIFHFRKEQKREDRRKEKRTVREEE